MLIGSGKKNIVIPVCKKIYLHHPLQYNYKLKVLSRGITSEKSRSATRSWKNVCYIIKQQLSDRSCDRHSHSSKLIIITVLCPHMPHKIGTFSQNKIANTSKSVRVLLILDAGKIRMQTLSNNFSSINNLYWYGCSDKAYVVLCVHGASKGS